MITAIDTTTLPGGRVVAVTGSDDATVRIWDLAAGAQLGATVQVVEAVTALAVSHATAGDIGLVLGVGGTLAAVTVRLGEQRTAAER